MNLSFFGAAGEVTGSCYFIQSQTANFLVDCGMFQGGHEADLKNKQFPGFDVAAVDFVLLTHAHIDHSGMLPRLTALGFSGPIYCTPATADLLGVMLRDSAHIQEKEAEWEELHRQKTHRINRMSPAEPLYTLTDVEACLKLLHRVDYGVEVHPSHEIASCFHDAGHILGSAILEIWLNEGGKKTKIVCSGDLGQPGRPILRNPTPISQTDVLLIESTYGNRMHKPLAETINEFVDVVRHTLEHKHGNIIMPAFTIGRTQELIYLMIDLTRQGRLPPGIKVYVDSPLALAATEITMRHVELFNTEAQQLVAWANEHPNQMPDIRFIQDVEESIAINEIKSGAIIISASGMCDAGRIKHHLRWNLNRPECSIVITGFQAQGTLGRRLVDGARLVKIFGQEIPVRASIHTIGGLSAHADQNALLGWLRQFSTPPRQTLVVHGESATAEIFANLISDELGWNVRVPEFHERLEITPNSH